jgi:hypothetical protein
MMNNLPRFSLPFVNIGNTVLKSDMISGERQMAVFDAQFVGDLPCDPDELVLKSNRPF